MSDDKKKPLHDVLSNILEEVSAGVSEFPTSRNAATARVILFALHEGDISPEAAHRIAKHHSRLPKDFRNRGQDALATLADRVLFDLRNRK